MGLEIANENRVISITPLGGWTPASPVYTEIPALFAKLSGAKILLDQITWTITGCVLPTYSHVSGGSLNPILSTATKVKCDGKFVLRKNDSGVCQGTFSKSGSTVTCSCNFQITDAGQSAAKGV